VIILLLSANKGELRVFEGKVGTPSCPSTGVPKFLDGEFELLVG
jgi:hypothetical protein